MQNALKLCEEMELEINLINYKLSKSISVSLCCYKQARRPAPL